MKYLSGFFLLAALSLPSWADLLINEISATHSDRLLVRASGAYPRVGNTIPWQSADYDDSNWQSGNGPFGFGTSVSLGTNVSGEIQNLSPSLYLRKNFTVSAGNAASGATLQLDVRYDDGFIAFLNGVEVARRNMGFPEMFAFRDQPAYNASSSTAITTINLGTASSLLQEGDNLLCIQVHNQTSSGGGDILLAADLKLSGGTIMDGDTAWKYFGGLAEPSGGLVDYGLLKLEAEEAPDVLWATPSFDDSTWPSGVGPVGYDISGTPDYIVGLDLQGEMRGVTPSVYVRNRFTVSQAEADSPFPLSLDVDFDDGLIVYVNGFEVYRNNVGTAGVITEHDLNANGNHAATGDGGNPTDRTVTISLDPARDLLVAGDNVIGFQLHNASAGSSDLFGEVVLSSTGASPRELVSGTAPLRYFVGTAEPVEVEVEDFEILEDPFDSENDWIEIRNTSGIAVSLDGWSLSDDPTDQRKWSFPDGEVVPANGYYIVAATGLDLSPAQDGTTYLHTNFKLSSSGDRVVLTRPDGLVEDQLVSDYPVQSWRHTYGRQSDGIFGYLGLGTPGAANVGSALGVAPALPQFSAEGGFHASSLNLVLSSATPGAIVRYTTDGTDPIDGVDYTAPISITGNTAIRARSFLAGSIPSEIVTHTYLIGQSSVFQGLPAMILSGDPAKTFYGPNTSGGPADGEGVFAINGGAYNGGQWSANGEQDAFNHPKGSGRSAEKYGALEYLPLSGEPLRTGLGMRVAGSAHTRQRLKITDPMDQPFTSTSTSSTKFEKPSMNIFFRPEFGDRPINYPFYGSNTVTEFDSLRVRAGKNDWYNPFIKDELMRRIFLNTGQVGSYGTMHTLWINGVYKGYYNTAERIREGFMQAHYNSKASWDVQQVNSFSSGDPTNWNEMISYLRTTDLTTTAGYAGVHDYLDVDNYIDYILVNAYAAMGDWPHNNWIAARERSAAGRWRFYMWDAEGSFGFSGRSTSTNSFTEQLTLPSTRYPTASAMTTTSQYVQAIYTLLKQSPEFRLRMADRGQKHLFNGGALVTSEVSAIYNELRSEISPIIQATGNGAFRSSFYNGWIANGTRYNALLNQLGGENSWPATDAPTINQFGGEISVGFQAMLGNPNGGGTVYFTTDGADPRAPGGGVVGTAYTGVISINDDTRVRARVLESGTWSPEIDVEFSLPFANPTFLPLASADWTADGNWSSSPAAYPNGDGLTAVVPGSPGADRNVNLREPVTIGRLVFDLENTTSRTRVRDRNSGNSLTFSDTGGTAEIEVTGVDEGFAELEVDAGIILSSDLRLEVQNVAGDSEYGALRLRSGWSGSGGLTKAGSGVTSLTGSGKSYTGATVVELGVLRLTEPAAPSASSSLSVMPGGQLRLVSGTGSGDPARDYAFGGTLQLSGVGRGAEIADGGGNGKRGALRYEPGNDDNHAIVSTAVSLSGPATIHVEGVTNLLELSMPLAGSDALTKSGGGTLFLAGDQSAHSYPVSVESGTLEIQSALGSVVDLAPTANLEGHGSVASVTGEGGVVLKQTLIDAASSSASRYVFVFDASGDPVLGNAASSGNAAVILENAPTGVLELDLYLTGAAQAPGAVSRGGIIVPASQDLLGALSSATVRVFSSDPVGNHQFGDQIWSQTSNYSLKLVQTDLGQPAPFEQLKILELTNGPVESFEDWRQRTFSAAELADPLISGPQTSPFGDGVENLLRYAFGVPAGENASSYLPGITSDSWGVGVGFPYDGSRDDISVVVESSDSLQDWSGAVILFDSATSPPPVANELGRIRIADPRPEVQSRFYRVRVVQN
ncbi:MAG: CotH kinase family protein [Akkermansiaceae bacterium]|nr:CotH kinase family protein [Akkermansiaceae bacterium]